MASRTRGTMAIGLLPLLALVTSCGGDGLSELGSAVSSNVADASTGAPEAGSPATDPPPATDAPAPTDAPAATDAPPGTDAATDGDGGISTGLLVALILLGVGVLVAVVVAATRRRPAAPTDDPRRRDLSTARWIHDQLSLEILALPPADAQARWNTERVRFDQLVIDLRSIAPSQRSPTPWDQLALAVAALASSLDTAVRVRASQEVDPDMARESVAIANGHRADLQRTLLAAEQAM